MTLEADLKKSGLTPKDVKARVLSPTELAACGAHTGSKAEGYVIPYFDIKGNPVPFYRLKMLTGDIKYLQPKGTLNYVYFPPGLNELLGSKRPYIIITEGEKKAACAVKMGFPCIALGGVDNWKSASLLLPEHTHLEKSYDGKSIKAKIPSNYVPQLVDGTLAVGMQDLISMCIKESMHVVIIYDTDGQEGVKSPVQTAAAKLGYELKYQGVATQNIRQLILPSKAHEKVGLDDFLIAHGSKALQSLIHNTLDKRAAFPRHPNPSKMINQKMNSPRMSRRDASNLALAILMELESRGRRLRAEDSGELNYFDEQIHTLMRVSLAQHHGAPLHETPFGSYLYKNFNLSANDTKVLGWLATQFAGEPGIEVTRTHKVLAFPKDLEDCIAYQLSDSHFAVVTPDPIEPLLIVENGAYGILFEQNQVRNTDWEPIRKRFYDQVTQEPSMYWLDVMKGLNFRVPEMHHDQSADVDQLRLLAALLCYISPWLLRWRGTQLPIELIIGEAGSGKSSLYGLRQTIISGASTLSNMTNDIRDWYAGITSTGGMHVLDNVHFTGSQNDYRQRLSDEICRLVTEPDPHVEMRKLYTNNEIISLSVNATFALTAIEQPFFNTDLIQRSAVLELQAIASSHESRWTSKQLNRLGGRSGWVAHQLVCLHRFLKLAVYDGAWNPNYKAGHRLANYEQCLQIMALTFGLDIDWIPGALSAATSTKISEADWVLQGLLAYASQVKDPHKRFGVKEICAWAAEHNEYHSNGQLTNSWRLGRYMQAHMATIEQACNIVDAGKVNNKRVFSVPQTT